MNYEEEHALSPLRPISPPQSFPCCLVWTPLPVLAWIFPIIGHAGIGLSDGTVLDFAGPYFVNEAGLAFGNPTWVVQLKLHHAEDLQNIVSTQELIAAYDSAVRRGALVYRGQMYYIWNNCFQFVSHCLNIMGYKGRRNWNMVYLAIEFIRNARFLSFWSFAKSWGPFLVLFPIALFFGGVTALLTWIGFVGILLTLIFVYSFLIYNPDQLRYMTPNHLDTSQA